MQQTATLPMLSYDLRAGSLADFFPKNLLSSLNGMQQIQLDPIVESASRNNVFWFSSQRKLKTPAWYVLTHNSGEIHALCFVELSQQQNTSFRYQACQKLSF